MTMKALSALYGGIVAARNTLYDRQWLRSRRLQGPVISIGNVSTGGSGKTPFVILLGQLLAARGIKFDVLSRGYGRRTRGVLVVDSRGSAQEYGDEPLLIARRLNVPVVVGEDRFEAGRLAESRFGLQIHLLDDGFQHRGLARDFDIVLVTPDDARDRPLPAGRLREPLTSLRRADAAVLVSGAQPESFPLNGKLLWRVRRGLRLPNSDQNPIHHPVVFCGIARPQSFLAQLRTAGIDPAAEAFFRDHHAYTEKDVKDLVDLRMRSEADGFVTTEKDAVNLGEHLAALKPAAIATVKMEMSDAANAVDTMLRFIEERRTQA
jgi:tetraacyldisaccharide 4'-kinase